MPKPTPAPAPDAEVLISMLRAYQVPIYMVVTVEQMEAICKEIGSGLLTASGAIKRHLGVTRKTMHRAIRAGEAAADKAARGERLDKREERALWFVSCLTRAGAQREMSLTSRALGIGPKGGDKRESNGALQILRLTCDAYRPDPPDLTDPEDAPPTDPTPAQAEAWIRREADRLGFTLTPKPAEE
ncbi:MAG: hypothetical protein KJT01_01260 [Gemmatimonadetes bacterium]|nr:hypothetical protein [Gemmatimonadota bacterium]